MDIALELLAPVSVGAAVVLLMEVVKGTFPMLESRWLRLIAVLLSLLTGWVLLVAEQNVDVRSYLESALKVIGASQALYSLIFKDSSLQKSFQNEPKG